MDGPLGNGKYSFDWEISRLEEYSDRTRPNADQLVIDFQAHAQLFGNKLETVRIRFFKRSAVRDTIYQFQMVNETAIVHPYAQEESSQECKCLSLVI